MSHIIGGGGGGGLTEDQVNTLIGRGQANGTAGLDESSHLIVPGSRIRARIPGGPGNIAIYSGSENALTILRESANNYNLEVRQNNQYKNVITEGDRNGATLAGVAGIYNPCKTILNEHRPVCTKEYHLTGKYLDGLDNPDVWFPIKGAGVGASVSYANRVLTLNSGTGAVSASRCVIDQTKFPITSNFLEVTVELDHVLAGEGGGRVLVVGFMNAFSGVTDFQRATFFRNGSESEWRVGCNGGSSRISTLPLGRDLQPGDIVSIRLDRQEGSPNIDILRFYVNGQKQYESTAIPTENIYAGVGAFNITSLVDVGCEIGIKYFGVRYVP